MTGLPTPLDALLQALQQADPMERAAAAAALAPFRDARARQALEAAARDPHWPVRAAALRALGDPEHLAAALRDPVIPVRIRAVERLGEAPDAPAGAAEALLGALGDADAAVRDAALALLARLGVTPTERLCELLSTGDAPLRRWAVERLGEAAAGARRAVPALEARLRPARWPAESDAGVREAVRAAIGRIREAARAIPPGTPEIAAGTPIAPDRLPRLPGDST